MTREVTAFRTAPLAELDDHVLQGVLESMQGQSAVLDGTGRVVAANRAWQAVGAEPGAALAGGEDFLDRLRSLSRGHPAAFEALAGVEGVLSGRLGSYEMDYDGTGEDRTYGLTVAPLGGRVAGAVVTNSDVTWRKALERQLSHRATHDALTGLPNRLLLADRLTQAIGRATRSGRLVGVLFCDLDEFKAVNDALGHAAGDQVLVAVGRRLSRACRACDSVTRFGGDEFVVVIEDVETADGVRSVAQRLLDTLSGPVAVDGSELYFGASIGVAIADGSTPATPQLIEDLLRDADTAMYRAKAAGRGRIVIFDPDMREGVASRLAVTTALRHAVERQELRVQFQPLYACGGPDGGTLMVGAEALVRWEHPERGTVPPGDFIPAAEESGLIVDIGAWVLDESCRMAALWAPMAPAGFTVHVNLSPRQLAHPGIVEVVADCLERHALPACALGLEITEGALMEDPEAVAVTLEQLHELGVGLSVDDFGTGYSSLAYLQRFPVDSLKIDRSFVSRLTDDPKTAALVAGIVELARALGLRTVAEGVETDAQLEAITRLGCTSFQGFLRAAPRSPEALESLLRDPL